MSALQRDASSCASAWNRGQYPLFVSYLSKRFVPDARARASILGEIQDGFSFGGYQFNTFQVSLGRIPAPKKYRTLYATVFPVEALVKGPGMRITDTGYVLAVSEDSGKTWRFVPLINYDPGELDRQFPEFERKISIPAQSEPTVEIVGPE